MPHALTRFRAEFERNGFAVIRAGLSTSRNTELQGIALRLFASDTTEARTHRSADDSDEFSGIAHARPSFRPLLANTRVLPAVAVLLGPNIHLLSSRLIANPPIENTGHVHPRSPLPVGSWRRASLSVDIDLGQQATPRLSITCAYHLTPGPAAMMFLPGSYLTPALTKEQAESAQPDEITIPDIEPGDVVIFENRTWHANIANTTQKPRIIATVDYGYRWLTPEHRTKYSAAGLTAVHRQLLDLHQPTHNGHAPDPTGSRPLRQWCTRHTCTDHHHIRDDQN